MYVRAFERAFEREEDRYVDSDLTKHRAFEREEDRYGGLLCMWQIFLVQLQF
jgi:hypothetical protein